MGEENKLDLGNLVLMVSDDNAMKTIGKVVDNSVQFESEDESLAIPNKTKKEIPRLHFSINPTNDYGKALISYSESKWRETTLKTANRMLDRLKNLRFLQREKCTCRRERREYQREIDKLSRMLTRYCKDNGLKMYKKDEL